MERSTRSLAVLLGILALAASGCGPTKSTALIMDADVELEAARAADGAKLAPYEFTAAEAYLRKAREEQGYADFEVSIGFGEKAVKFAKDAKTKAMAARSEGALPNAPPGLAPPPPPPSALDAPRADQVDKVEPSKPEK